MKGEAEHVLPRIAALGLVMAGAGLIGMTAGDLPGIPQQIAAPRWLLGAVGGVLIACGWQVVRGLLSPRFETRARWPVFVACGAGGIGLAALSALTRANGGTGPAFESGVALNSAARVVFAIGTGIVIGWAAYEGSQSRGRNRSSRADRGGANGQP
jgi:hypothetical protein